MRQKFPCSERSNKYPLLEGINPRLAYVDAAVVAFGKAIHGCHECGMAESGECVPSATVMRVGMEDNPPINYGVEVKPTPGQTRIIRSLR